MNQNDNLSLGTRLSKWQISVFREEVAPDLAVSCADLLSRTSWNLEMLMLLFQLRGEYGSTRKNPSGQCELATNSPLWPGGGGGGLLRGCLRLSEILRRTPKRLEISRSCFAGVAFTFLENNYQGWYMIESKLDAKNCNRGQRLVVSLQQGVGQGVASNEVISWATDHPLNANGDDLRWKLSRLTHAKRVKRDNRKNPEYRVLTICQNKPIGTTVE